MIEIEIGMLLAGAAGGFIKQEDNNDNWKKRLFLLRRK